MQIKNLYRYERDGGGVTTSLEMPSTEEYTLMYRVIAGKRKAITNNGKDLSPVIDTGSFDEWIEVDAPTVQIHYNS